MKSEDTILDGRVKNNNSEETTLDQPQNDEPTTVEEKEVKEDSAEPKKTEVKNSNMRKRMMAAAAGSATGAAAATVGMHYTHSNGEEQHATEHPDNQNHGRSAVQAESEPSLEEGQAADYSSEVPDTTEEQWEHEDAEMSNVADYGSEPQPQLRPDFDQMAELGDVVTDAVDVEVELVPELTPQAIADTDYRVDDYDYPNGEEESPVAEENAVEIIGVESVNTELGDVTIGEMSIDGEGYVLVDFNGGNFDVAWHDDNHDNHVQNSELMDISDMGISVDDVVSLADATRGGIEIPDEVAAMENPMEALGDNCDLGLDIADLSGVPDMPDSL